MGEELVLIPGLVSDRQAWRDVEQELLNKGLKTTIADISKADSLTSMAQTILDQTDGPLIPVGHSMGGRVAMEIARLAPERLEGLVLVATGAHPLAEGELPKRERVIELANTQGMQALCDQWLPPMMAPDTCKSDSQLYRTLEQMVLDAGAEVHERQIRALIARPDARSVLESLSAPTLFVAGEYDGWSTPDQHRAMAALVGNAPVDVEVVAGAGHFLQAEQPIVFTQLLLNWLQRAGLS